MALFRLAIRNLLRQKRRTALTAAAIVGGLTLMVWTIHFARGSYDSMLRNGISEQAGHVVVQAEGWQEDRKTERVVPDSAGVVAALLEAVPGATITRRVFAEGLLSSAAGASGVSLVGVDPVDEARVTRRDDQVTTGAWLEAGDAQGIVLGDALAKKLGVGVGDKVVYMGQHGEEMTSRLFRVRGLSRTGALELDAFSAVVVSDAAAELIERPGAAHQVALHLDNPGDTDTALAAIRGRLGENTGLVVRPWADAIPEITGLIRVDRRTNDILMSVIGLIVAMGVLNTMLMSVMERVREFGVMLAVGMRPGWLARLVLTEALLLGSVSIALGVLFGSVLAWPLVVYGMDVSSFSGGEGMSVSGMAMDTVLYAGWDFPRVTAYAVGGLVFTVLAAAFPAWRVTRLTPVDAMRRP